MQNLISWAGSEREPLASYATGLLGAAMDIQEVAGNFKESNAQLVPKLLKKLRALQKETEAKNRESETQNASDVTRRHFANVEGFDSVTFKQPGSNNSATKPGVMSPPSQASKRPRDDLEENESEDLDESLSSPPAKASKLAHSASSQSKILNILSTLKYIPFMVFHASVVSPHAEDESIAWEEQKPYIISTYHMHPLGLLMKQRLILQYLTPMGEYQELLPHVLEHNALDLMFFYIDLKQSRDARLSFEATRVRMHSKYFR